MKKLKHLMLFENYDNIVNESIISKIKNRKLINKIEEIVEDNDIDEMINFIRTIGVDTARPNSVKADLLKERTDKGENLKTPNYILTSLIDYLKNNDLKDIRIYGPNQGLNGWLVSDQTLSFSG